MRDITQDHLQRAALSWPEIFPGDLIQVQLKDHMSAPRPSSFKGICIAKPNKQLDTSIVLLNVVHGQPVVRSIKLHSPLLQGVEVLKELPIRVGMKGGKRGMNIKTPPAMRKKKLWHLKHQSPRVFTFK